MTHNPSSILTVGSKFKSRGNILVGKFWKIIHNIRYAHARSHVSQYIFDRDAHITNARLAASLIRLYGYDVFINRHVLFYLQK
jgi:hypothetical protein